MEEKHRILIIDDDRELNALLTRYLAKFDLEVLSATHPTLGLELLRTQSPALVVLDVMLPGKNGFEVCKEIRAESRVPIIMLTARGDLSDRVVGLELGADDYMAKPYEPRELVARIQSVLRRLRDYQSTVGAKKFLRSQSLTVDLNRATAILDGRALDLTSTEFEILRLLMERGGSTLSRDQILEGVRGLEHPLEHSGPNMDRTIDVLVSRLRHKLGDDPKTPRYLKTVWGSGYRFISEVSSAS